VGSKDHRKSSKSDRPGGPSVLGDIRMAMRELLAVCLKVERAHIAYACGIRTALTLMAVLWVARSFGGMEFAMPMAVGILMVNLADVCEPHGLRWRTMLWATACASLSTWLAGMVSSEPAAHLIAGILLAALLGYVAALGTKSSLIGSIGLCMFSLYAGSEIGSHRALVDALGVGAGGAVATLVATAGWPLRRLEVPRVQIAIAYEKFACACADVQTRWSSTNVASAILDAAKTVETSSATDATEVWLRKFLEDLEHCRRVLLARALAAGLALKNRAPRVRAELERFQAACEACDDPASAELVRHMRDRLTDAGQLIAGRWPIGRAAAMRTVKSQFPDIRQVIRQHTRMSDSCVRHAMKLSIAYGLAVAVSLVIGMTLAVLSLGALAGVAVEAEAFVRLLATLLAGSLVALTALVYPLRKGAAVSGHLSSMCSDLRAYAENLRCGKPQAELSKARAALLRDRTNAALTLAAAAAEPPALWERGRVHVDVAGAKVVLHDLEAELSKLIAIDILGHQLRDSPTAWPQFETTLRDIERRIGGLCGTKASES
jgi:hypothetical protein